VPVVVEVTLFLVTNFYPEMLAFVKGLNPLD
jgi:hypothetical protein